MNYEHPNKIEAPCQKNELFGRTEFSLHGVGQMGRLIVYLSVTLRWVTVTVLTDCFYPVEHLFLQIGISIHIPASWYHPRQ